MMTQTTAAHNAGITSPGIEVPDPAVNHFTLPLSNQRCNCYFILFPTVKMKGVVGCISADSDRVPFALFSR